MFFAVLKCSEKSLKIIFVKGKQLSAVTAVNEFTECVNEFQMVCLTKKKNSKYDWLCYQCSSKRAKDTCT